VLDPVQRWQMSDQSKFEVWPLPASPAQVRFIQNRSFQVLTTGSTNPPTWNDAALVDLDSILVALHVAALYRARQEGADAAILLKRAGTRLMQLLGNNPVRTETIKIGRGSMPFSRQALRQVPIVVVAGGTH